MKKYQVKIEGDSLAMHLIEGSFSGVGAQATASNLRRAFPGLDDEQIIKEIEGLSTVGIFKLVLSNPKNKALLLRVINRAVEEEK